MQKQPIESSKLLKIHVLISYEEMEALLAVLESPYIFRMGCVIKPNMPSFLEEYQSYVAALKKGETLRLGTYGWTETEDAIISLHNIFKPSLPLIQLRPHNFSYSPIDGKFRSMVKGLSWGFQFSYPQVFQKGHEIHVVDKSFPNTQLFQRLQRWMRHHTRAAAFEVDGKVTRVPIRIGNLDWVPQLGEIKCVLK